MAILQVFPSSLTFGNVAAGSSVTLTVSLNNADSFQSINFGVTSNNTAFSPSASGGMLGPLQSVPGTVTYFASLTPGNETGNITISGDMDNSPVVIPCFGTSVATGTPQISVNPSSWVFPSTRVGMASASQNFVVTNTGTANLTVQIPVFTAPFSGVGLPGGPTVLTPGQTLSFGAVFTPAGRGYVLVPNGISITSNAPTSPTLVSLAGTGAAINPAYTVVGGAENGFVAFGSNLRQFQATNFNCEGNAFAQKLIQPAQGMEATLQRVLVQFEDIGPATLEVSAQANRYSTILGATTDQFVFQIIQVGSTSATQAVVNAMADLVVQGNLIRLGFVPHGPLFLVSYDPEIVPAGEVKKT